MFTHVRSGGQPERFRRCIVLLLCGVQKKKVLQHNAQWFSAVKTALALATVAAIGTMMPLTRVSLTVTTRRTRIPIAITITAVVALKPFWIVGLKFSYASDKRYLF